MELSLSEKIATELKRGIPGLLWLSIIHSAAFLVHTFHIEKWLIGQDANPPHAESLPSFFLAWIHSHKLPFQLQPYPSQ